jgi:hypothetical protein
MREGRAYLPQAPVRYSALCLDYRSLEREIAERAVIEAHQITPALLPPLPANQGRGDACEHGG